jgi:hypothetical protein
VKIMLSQDSSLTENGYSLEEQAEIYNNQLVDILENTRWYLDNLDSMKVYRVAWKSYSRSKVATLPYCYTKNG